MWNAWTLTVVQFEHLVPFLHILQSDFVLCFSYWDSHEMETLVECNVIIALYYYYYFIALSNWMTILYTTTRKHINFSLSRLSVFSSRSKWFWTWAASFFQCMVYLGSFIMGFFRCSLFVILMPAAMWLLVFSIRYWLDSRNLLLCFHWQKNRILDETRCDNSESYRVNVKWTWKERIKIKISLWIYK